MVENPSVIQGGLGAGVSGWKLANAVAREGQLGFLANSNDVIVARLLQIGDPGGDIRRTAELFPIPQIKDEIINRYYVPGGKDPLESFKPVPMLRINMSEQAQKLAAFSNFVAVKLAKEDHNGVVGINFLTKMPFNIPSIWGAMMAGVDYIAMGAGIPNQIPKILDKLAKYEEVSYRLDVEGGDKNDLFLTSFDPKTIMDPKKPQIEKPKFLIIVSHHALAKRLVDTSGEVNGIIVEDWTAGGHNAPQRDDLFTADGQALYNERDIPDIGKIRKLGVPFWLAGSCASPQKLREAWALGAQGIQAGSIFALSRESGLREDLKRVIRRRAFRGELTIITDPHASPSGFPFKTVLLPDTLASKRIFNERNQMKPYCDMGRLRSLRKNPNGSVSLFCPAAPQLKDKDYSNFKNVLHHRCLCNALLANIGLGQIRDGKYQEPDLVTLGLDLSFIRYLMENEDDSYSVRETLHYLFN